MADVGAQTPFFYICEREIYDLWEAATGYRMVNNYFSALVVWQLTSHGWVDKCELCDYFSPKVDEYERLITDNPIFRRR